MFLLLTLLGCAFSTLSLIWLVGQSERRRRAHRLPASSAYLLPKGVLLALTLMPGVVLLLMGYSGGFVIWLSVISMTGWLAVVKPVAKGAS